MSDTIKNKLTGWSATVGLVALGLLGHSSQGQAAVPAWTGNTPNPDKANQLSPQQRELRNEFAQESPPPPPPWFSPPPPPPPAVGGVRG